ncbi:cold shock domain-containing protein [Candidatus Cytomitobacter primus]|uniref:CSD domain-containing protein n=1 Tax=Candidatus Cytomitobacter primus TaxID=2066024 RepID=A0A5C0UES9_9PROT|nr:cold shock domain-containing protein [Candidatus Cytomitobacter primus]QEK38605.1 hypothetical protein FZC34_01630 [Candidatus Cytomitobacter primus]
MNSFSEDNNVNSRKMGSCFEHGNDSSDQSVVYRTCTIKWFKNKKGYGFLISDDISEDIFLHHSKIKEAGINVDLIHGDTVECDIIMVGHMQKPHVVKVHNCLRKNANLKNLVKSNAIVKWFNAVADYGFLNNGHDDIFVSGTLLRKFYISDENFCEGVEVECYFLEIENKKIAYQVTIPNKDEEAIYA